MADDKSKPKKKRAKKEASEKKSRVSTLQLLEYLRGLNFKVDEYWIKNKVIPYASEGDTEATSIKATNAFFQRVMDQLLTTKSRSDWQGFWNSYNLNKRAKTTRSKLLNPSEAYTKKIVKQGQDGYFVRVPFMDVWLGDEYKNKLTDTKVKISYSADSITITVVEEEVKTASEGQS